ncbi:MAG: phosphotransferase [Myxococcota bacterium]
MASRSNALSVPANAEAIYPDWLSGVLDARYPGIQVAEVTIADAAEVTNSHAWLEVNYSAPEEAARLNAPTSIFCKLLPNDPARRVAIAHTQMGLREARFYDSLGPKLSMRIPKVHGVCFEEAGQGEGAFIILLENLVEAGCTVSSGPESPTPDAAAKALEDLAELHVRFEDPARRKAAAGWVCDPDPPSDYGSLRLQEGLDHHREKLSPAFAEMSEIYIAHQAALHAVWAEGPKTVIHGDLHIGNLFDDHGQTGFLDWGLVVVSTPLRDVSYFLNMCLSIDDRRANQERLIQHYLDVRRSLGGETISFDAAWRTHRLQAAYLAPASCQIVTFPEDVTPRRKKFAAAFLARAEAAIEDLESRSALREFAGI